jgi:hypothetical protein
VVVEDDRCASRRSSWARPISMAGADSGRTQGGERVVVYSQKALTANSRFKVVDSLPGYRQEPRRDQPGRTRHPAFLGQVRLHRRRPGPADRRHPDHGRGVSRHGRRCQGLLDNSGADLWVVQQDTLGPYAESSSLYDDTYRGILGMKGWRARPTSPT